MDRPIILFVDDDEDHRELVGMFLAASGFEVVFAGSAGDAIAAIRAGGVDAVLADVTLPDHDGWEVARAAKAQPRPLPVVMLTGWSLTLDGAEAPVDAVMGKPVVRTLLVETFRTLLG